MRCNRQSHSGLNWGLRVLLLDAHDFTLQSRRAILSNARKPPESALSRMVKHPQLATIKYELSFSNLFLQSKRILRSISNAAAKVHIKSARDRYRAGF